MPTKPAGRCPCGQRATYRGKCDTHAKQAEQDRGTRQQRGYDTAHTKERERWAPLVHRGLVTCTRCGRRITPPQPWDLGHNDQRTAWTGPEHATCNRGARKGGG